MPMEIRMKKIVILLALAPLMLATACGSGGGPANPAAAQATASFAATPVGTLNAWAFNNADDVGKARIAYVGTKLHGVNIKYDYTAFDAQKFTTRLASGNVPDVVQMDRQYVTTYAAQGLLTPMDSCFSANHVDPTSLFYPSVLSDVTYDGHVWGAPQFYQPPALILDENVLKAAGVTDDQINTSKPAMLLAAIKKMYKTSGGNPSVLGFDPQAGSNGNVWILALGGRLVDKNGKPTLADPANVYPLELLKKITDAQGGYAKLKSFTDTFDYFGDNNQYVKNQVGAELNFQWYPNVLAPYMNKISVSAVPIRDKNGKPITTAGGQAFVIPAKAKNPVAACKWAIQMTTKANWMAAAAARAQTLKKTGGVDTGLFTGEPAADRAIKQKYVKPSGNAGFDAMVNTYYDIVSDGVSNGASPAGQQIQTALNDAVTQVLLGQKDAKAALSDAQSRAMRAYNNAVR
jgi:multiple sugar transport system substrate-binding protein